MSGIAAMTATTTEAAVTIKVGTEEIENAAGVQLSERLTRH